MKLRIPIRELRSGMFLEASVLSVMKDDSVRHFLDLRGAAYSESTSRRLRLMKRRHEQVNASGGMLVRSAAQVEALQGLGVIEVTINTDKSEVVQDLVELRSEKAAAETADKPTGQDDDDDLSIGDLDALETTAQPGEPVPQAAAAAAASDRRRNFGASKSGWMKVNVSHTKGEAVLQVLSFGGDATLSEQDMVGVLQDEYGIKGGLDVEMVKRLAMQAAASPGRVLRGHFPIGTDLELDRSTLGHVEFTCWRELPEGTDHDGAALQQAFSQSQLSQVLEGALWARRAIPEEELARFIPAGTDRGSVAEEDLAEMAKPLLRAGPHVRAVGGSFLSQQHGYVCVVDDEISIIPPIWMTVDRMQAYFIRLPQIGTEVTLTEHSLRQLLQLCEVRQGLKVDALEQLLQQPPSPATAEAIVLAEGTPNVEPEAASVSLLFAPAGNQDLAGHDAPIVSKGDLLAEITPPTAGKPGTDVTGTQTSAKEADSATLMAGTNVRAERREGRTCLFAEQDGRTNIRNQVLSVRPLSIVEGDLGKDLEVEAGRDVHVRGSLKSGVKLIANGGVIIDGEVENGAQIDCEGDVTVEGGVAGSEARVVAAGNICVGFALQSSLTAGGDITISDRVEEAQVRAGKRLLFHADGGGQVVGGVLTAGAGIEARAVRGGTQLTIAADDELSEKIEQAEGGLATCRTHTLRIFRTLAVNEISATHFKRLIETSPPGARKKVAGLLKQLKVVASSRAVSQERKRELEEKQARIYAEAPITITEEIEAGVRIEIGEVAFEVAESRSGVAFSQRGGVVVSLP